MTNMHNTKALQLQLKIKKMCAIQYFEDNRNIYAAQKKLFDNISVLTEKL